MALPPAPPIPPPPQPPDFPWWLQPWWMGANPLLGGFRGPWQRLPYDNPLWYGGSPPIWPSSSGIQPNDLPDIGGNPFHWYDINRPGESEFWFGQEGMRGRSMYPPMAQGYYRPLGDEPPEASGDAPWMSIEPSEIITDYTGNEVDLEEFETMNQLQDMLGYEQYEQPQQWLADMQDYYLRSGESGGFYRPPEEVYEEFVFSGPTDPRNLLELPESNIPGPWAGTATGGHMGTPLQYNEIGGIRPPSPPLTWLDRASFRIGNAMRGLSQNVWPIANAALATIPVIRDIVRGDFGRPRDITEMLSGPAFAPGATPGTKYSTNWARELGRARMRRGRLGH